MHLDTNRCPFCAKLPTNKISYPSWLISKILLNKISATWENSYKPFIMIKLLIYTILVGPTRGLQPLFLKVIIKY